MLEKLVGKQIKEARRASFDEIKKARLQNNKSWVEFGDYDTDGGEIAIVFTDNSFIVIRGSEWGSMQFINIKQNERRG